MLPETRLERVSKAVRFGVPLPEGMTPEQFTEDRRRGLGSSDWTDALDIPPYGCSRKLVYDKRGTPADFPFTGNAYTVAGNRLEGTARGILVEERGATIHGHNRLIEDVPGMPPWFRVNVDAIASIGIGKPFAEETKVMSPPVFSRLKRDPLPLHIRFQLMAEMVGVGNLSRGVLFAYQPIPEETHWQEAPEITAKMLEQMVDIGDRIWDRVHGGELPERKEPGAAACSSCPWRLTCWEGLPPMSKEERPTTLPVYDNPEAIRLVEEYIDIRDQAKVYETLKKALSEDLKGVSDLPAAALIGGHKVYCDHTAKTSAAGIRKDIVKMVRTEMLNLGLEFEEAPCLAFLLENVDKLKLKAVEKAYPDLFERHQTRSPGRTLKIY